MPNLNSGLPPFPFSYIVDKKEMDKLIADIEKHQVSIIQGHFLTGKSSLLTYIGHELSKQQKTVFFINKDSRFNSDEVNAIIEFINNKKAILIIDDFDNITNHEKLLSHFLQNLKFGRLVVSCNCIPDIDPIILFDFNTYSIKPLNKSQLLQLADRFNFTQEVIDVINTKTLGHPFLAKAALSICAIEQKDLKELPTEEIYKKSKKQYFLNIFNQLEDKAQRHLKFFSLFEYQNGEIYNFYLKNFHLLSEKELLVVKAIDRSIGLMGLMSEFKAFIKESIVKKEEEAIRKEIINFLQDEKSYLYNKELVFQLMMTNDIQNFGREFKELAPQMLTKCDLVDLECFSSLYQNELPLDTLAHRTNALSILNQRQKALDELSKHDFSCNHQMALIEVKLLQQLGDFNQAMTKIMDLVNSQEMTPSMAIKTLVEKSKILRGPSPQKSLALLLQARNLYEEQKLTDQNLLAEINFFLGRLYQLQSEELKALPFFYQAKKIYDSLNNIYLKAMTDYNLMTINYNIGKINEAIKGVEEVKQISQKYTFWHLYYHTVIFEARHLSFQGLFKKSNSILDDLDKKLEFFSSEENISDKQFLIKKGLFENHVASGDLFKALNIIRSLLKTNYVLRNLNLSQYLRLLTITLEKASSNDMSDLTIKKLTKRLAPLPIKYKISLLGNLFELKQKLGCGENIFELFDETLFKDSPINQVLRFKYLKALHLVSKENYQDAKIILNMITVIFHDAKFYLWELRCHIELIYLNILEYQYDEAYKQLNEALLLSESIDPQDEFDILAIYELALSILTNKKDKAFKLVSSLPFSHQFYGHRYYLNTILNTNFRPERKKLPFNMEQRFQSIMSILGISDIKKIVLKNRHGQQVVFINELQKEDYTGYDVYINDIEGKIKIQDKEIDLLSKDILRGMLRLFLTNPGKYFTKEEITVATWFENYDPLIHDSRIYTSVRRLRNILKKVANEQMILSEDGKYYGRPSLNYIWIRPFINEFEKLNDRQVWIMNYLRRNYHLQRSQLSDILSISPSLAKLELRELIKRNLIVKVNKGKNTKYKIQNPV